MASPAKRKKIAASPLKRQGKGAVRSGKPKIRKVAGRYIATRAAKSAAAARPSAVLPTADVGMVGLGVMGRNFLLNMAESGFSVQTFLR